MTPRDDNPHEEEPSVPVESLAGLREAVEYFLGIALVEPAKPPRTIKAQRENRNMVIGYSRAQYDLRKLLVQVGEHELAKIENPDSVKPDKIGDTYMWVV